MQEPLDESSEEDEMYDDGHTMYDQQPKNYSQPTCPMNQENFHSVPKRKKIEGCRISLTFREIV